MRVQFIGTLFRYSLVVFAGALSEIDNIDMFLYRYNLRIWQTFVMIFRHSINMKSQICIPQSKFVRLMNMYRRFAGFSRNSIHCRYSAEINNTHSRGKVPYLNDKNCIGILCENPDICQESVDNQMYAKTGVKWVPHRSRSVT